ncbi:hypothetical protein K388_05610 [Streptomyces sp. KhCrAH-43]|uniref:hypothetical protein n=1 Tax=unclassified Streptomyces TaxID=2593676 RepID=UPI00036D189D|nr:MULTISPECIES: hypothetical protein [unclassified Streptomyces]MYX67335.1 hypothetical protein [Streptomyces sp. SID8373]RAJ53823.1 hypothetical protein K388_05610 [Streptomyces sp. KhCrAH-43]
MPIGRVNAAKFIGRLLPEPHETDFGGEEAHNLLATVHADWACPPSGHSISWSDCYASADQLPLTRKADLLLEPNGEPSPIPAHLVGEARERAVRAGAHAAWIRREAHRRGLH